MTMQRKPRQLRGFAMLIALAILALLGALIALTTRSADARARDILHEQREAQLRQLLLAGLSQAPDFLAQRGTHRSIAVPDQIGTLSLAASAPSGGASVVEVTAQVDDTTRQARATCVFQQNRWVISKVD